jgi:hypothetical protein
MKLPRNIGQRALMVVHVGEPIVSVDRFCPAESHDDDVPAYVALLLLGKGQAP